MAEIVLGLASTHGSPVGGPPSRWLQIDDRFDPRIDYEALLRRARPDMERELDPEVMERRCQSVQRSLAELRQQLLAARPDAILIFGDDQHEHLLDDNMPQFCVYRGSWMTVYPRIPGGKGERKDKVNPVEYEACPELAEQLIRHLTDHEFEVATSNRLRAESGLGHAFTFLYERLLPECSIPVVPFMVNTFYPPNQPTPKRCYAIGKAVREAIESWDDQRRVAVLASGGLSHTIIDEEIDQMLLDAMLEKDVERLCSLPVERMTLGTSENRNWIIGAGAMEPLPMTLLAYEPCYRSPAGTGCAAGFAYWK